jgi:dTDP-4-amino-4,6-dideoxygalactose transaminase
MIPCANPLAQYQSNGEAIFAAVRRVLERGNYILGPEVEEFEKAFAMYCGVRHGIGVGSGTDALILALKALNVGPGDEVITVSHTAIATVSAILAVGATPVLLDIEPDYYCLSADSLNAAMSPRAKAVIAVHLYGQPADLEAIISFTKRKALHLIEDCAQSTGASYKGRRVGSYGDLACFSFYPTKNLGAIGDGGMVVTSDPSLAARVRRLRQYGWGEARKTVEPGMNSRLDEIQAAILNVKLRTLDLDNARRAEIAKRYAGAFLGLPMNLPAVRTDANHVYHLYVLQCNDRNGLKAHLAEQQIMAGIHYEIPAHRHGGYESKSRLGLASLPITDRLVDRILSLPLYPELSNDDVNQVIEAVRSFYV